MVYPAEHAKQLTLSHTRQFALVHGKQTVPDKKYPNLQDVQVIALVHEAQLGSEQKAHVGTCKPLLIKV